jgi:hypothetical protein
MVREEAEKTIFGKTISEGLRFHITNDMPIRDNVYRHVISDNSDHSQANKFLLISR